MTPDALQERVDQVFVAAIELPVEQRESFLQQVTRDDPPAVYVSVKKLLDADDRADTQFAAQSPLNLQDYTTQDLPDPRIGATIGEYVIESRIASGGFGTVYKATRELPFREVVAIKLLHQENLAAPSIVKRVLREMQALSDLRHPHIVTQLNSDLTPNGEPYLVMEYIDGVPIDRYCDENQLSIEDRLRLFQKVCNAVQFAHEHGWVHRDLKPSNILVSSDGTPKLLDFGIAKLSAPDRARLDATATITRGIVGTPQYMSPEQFSGNSANPTSDIYSLGAILYELLSGHRAFDVMCRGIDSVLLEAIQNAVNETIPRRPSTLVNSDEKTATGLSKEALANQRSSSPKGLRRCLEGDIDNIAMMALRKEPERRYASAIDVSDDIQRWLEQRPVTARADSLSYRTHKFVRRRRRLLATVALVSVSLLIAAFAMERLRQAMLDRNQEQTRRLLTDGHRLLDENQFDEAMSSFTAAFSSAPSGAMRNSANRMIAAWKRYGGTPLSEKSNLRYRMASAADRLAVAQERKVTIWSPKTNSVTRTFRTENIISRITITDDGSKVAVLLENNLLELWDAENGKRRDQLNVRGQVASFEFVDGSLAVVSQSPEGVAIRQWNPSSHSTKTLFRQKTSDELISASIFPGTTALLFREESKRYANLVTWPAPSTKTEMVADAAAFGPSIVTSEGRHLLQQYRQNGEHRTAVVDLKTNKVIGDFVGQLMDVNKEATACIVRQADKLNLRRFDNRNELIVTLADRLVGRWDARFDELGQVLVADVVDNASTRISTIHYRKGHLFKHAAAYPRHAELASRNAFERTEFGRRTRIAIHDTRGEDADSVGRMPWLWRVEPLLENSIPVGVGPKIKAISTGRGFTLIATSSDLRCWDHKQKTFSQAALPQITAISYVDDSKFAVAGDAAGSIHAVSIPGLEVLHSHSLTKAPIQGVATNRDLSQLVAITRNRVDLLENERLDETNWSIKSVYSRDVHHAALEGVRYTEDQQSIVLGSHQKLEVHGVTDAQRVLRSIDLRVNGFVHDFVTADNEPFAVAIDQGKAWLITSAGKSVQLGSAKDCLVAALRADGKVAAVGHNDGGVYLWDVDSRLPLSRRLSAGISAVADLRFSESGDRLVSTTIKGTIRVWRTEF